MDSVMAPWKGTATLSTKSPSGNPPPVAVPPGDLGTESSAFMLSARGTPPLVGDGATTEHAATWYVKLSISGSNRQFAAST